MTNEIEMTKREMFRLQKEMLNDPYIDGVRNQCYRLQDKAYGKFESALEQHLEALRQDRGRLVEERDALRNRVQVLESANKIAGERLQALSEGRKQPSSTSTHETPQKASCATLDAKTATILGALVDAQRIMTDYLVPDGIRAKDAIGKLIPVLDNEKLCAAMRGFEQEEEEVTGASLSAKYFSGRTIASVSFDKMVRDAMRHGVGVIRMTSSEDGIEITNLPADEMRKVCQHEFHPKFPAGEMCTYCGVAK